MTIFLTHELRLEGRYGAELKARTLRVGSERGERMSGFEQVKKEGGAVRDDVGEVVASRSYGASVAIVSSSDFMLNAVKCSGKF